MSGMFGQRPSFKVLSIEKHEEYRLFHCEAGSWYGPTGPDDVGEYRKERFVVDERYPGNAANSSVSWWSDLLKALAA